ncbi:MAG TPA: hypothetical protein VGP63_29290 [Planctomycetaceae bacterium]|jgi:hypothetical protein|nr:hypothetical protein [Planctomycetaceae bacterium]
MSNEAKKRRSWRWSWWVVVLAFVAYPLSEGPASWFHAHYGREWTADALNTFYAPVQWCAVQSYATDDMHDSYIIFWITH